MTDFEVSAQQVIQPARTRTIQLSGGQTIFQDQGIQTGPVQIPGQPSPTNAGTPAAAVAASAAQQKRTAEMKQRLKKLAALEFNRLPSGIFDAWTATRPNFKKKADNNSDLPPAPSKAFLFDNVRFDIETKKLQSDFALGNWKSVGRFLEQLPKADAKKLYQRLLTSTSNSFARSLLGNKGASSRTDQRAFQMPYLTFEDVVALAEIRPSTIEKSLLPKFAELFNGVIQRGASVQDLLLFLRSKEVPDPPKKSDEELVATKTEASGNKSPDKVKEEKEVIEPFFTRRNIALILMSAGHPIEAHEFLPSLEQAQAANDHEALNLISRYALAQYARDTKTDQLEMAWLVTQAVLGSDQVDQTERRQALKRAVSLSTQVKKSLADKWLNETFALNPERGIEMLAGIGADVSVSLLRQPTQQDKRWEGLELQKKAVTALLKGGQKIENQWQKAIELMAMNWLREARVTYESDTSTQLGPSMQRDSFGNFYYQNFRNQYVNNRLTPITTGKLLKVCPTVEWLEAIDESMRPKFDMILGQLYLKVSEEEKALPYIEKVAKPYPRETEELVKEFLRVWTRNHNPNQTQQSSMYSFMYGYEIRSEGIPLTRSKQQRNLAQLAELIPKLQKLQTEPLDQNLVSQAFFASHSAAEVYRIEQIERIFGDFKHVKPKIVSNICQRMRGNLAGIWRDAKLQKQKKTKRKKKDIQEEVVRGYQVANDVLDMALEHNPDNWSLVMAKASIIHDENNYRKEMINSAEFSPRQKQAMAGFSDAATKYIEQIADKDEKDYSIDVFATWFYAGLGAVDLGLVDEKRMNDPMQPSLIRETILGMPDKQAKWHMDTFAMQLFQRMSSAKPHVKHRYLKGGFEIVGNHENAQEARAVFDYYNDLVTEIELNTVIDGEDQVGEKPFGMFVNLRHTKEIERESGGFGKYLQNQNSNMAYAYNYGRPTEDYRDKFEEGLRQTLSEHFDVLSVTFQKPSVKSAPSKRLGWRDTPYAYVLMKARGPQVDKIPSLKIDLDFLDTSGYTILPVESAAIPMDATKLVERPATNVRIVQILDERQSEDGHLVLEINATANGLVPSLDNVMEFDFSEFDITSIDDPGVSVAKFDEETDENAVLSERNWVVKLSAKAGMDKKPANFEFPSPNVDTQEVVYQRYVDADLATVEPVVLLEEAYGSPSYSSYYYAAIIGLAVIAFLVIGVTVFVVMPKRKGDVQRAVGLDATPFSVIAMMQDLQRNNGLNERQKSDLDDSINRLESYYFGDTNGSGSNSEPDLSAEIKKWVKPG